MAWMNCCLSELSLRLVEDISKDLHDGVVLGHLIQLTTGCSVNQNTKVSE